MAGHTPSARPLTARISHTIRRVIEALVMTILPWVLWAPGPLGFVALTSPASAGAMLARHPGEVKASRATSFRNPSSRPQQDTGLLAGHVLVEDSQLRPVEARPHLGEGAWNEPFVHLNDTEERVRADVSTEDVQDLGDGRRRAPEIEAARSVERLAPRRCDEDDEELAFGQAHIGEAGHVIDVQNLHGQSESLQIGSGEGKDSGIHLESQAPSPRHVTQQPVERVAGSGKEVDHEWARLSDQGGNLPPDRVAQAVPRALHHGAPQQADASGIPFEWPQAVDGDPLGVRSEEHTSELQSRR